ncbi:uncharacterized protein LOC133918062 [Phragmites australis]|uniref:uncharacterized protein LOC133918062 n=1 Tax=Phragmites australis TaxID=29695 RepID=UPI002D78D884|nr:uncharacterized protein LOC133918062 [Phragmites australis]
MEGKKPAAADVTIAVVLRPACSSSSSSAPALPRQTWSALQVVQGIVYGAPVLPVLENGCPAGAGEMLRLVAEGNVHGVVVGTTNSHLRSSGRIPMICPGGFIDLNAMAPDVGEPQAERLPVICAYCNCAFCFGEYEVSILSPPPGYIYPKPPVPVTADLLTPPPVGALYVDGGLLAPGTTPVPLVVCSDLHHFMVAMGMLKLPRGAPSLVWRRPTTLGVLPISVGATGGSLQHEEPAPGGSSSVPRAPAPPPNESSCAGARWKFVMPGHEDMVRLTLARRSYLDLDLNL